MGGKKPGKKDLSTKVKENYEIYKDIINEIDEVDQTLSTLSKKCNDLKKSRDKLDKKFKKEMDSIIKELDKNNQKKSKHKKQSGGITEPKPVPQVIKKFLDLEAEVLLTRPKVHSKLHAKFKELGFVEGQTVTLDKKTAKIFGKNGKSEYTIKFNEFQTFLKQIYDAEFKLNSTSTSN